MSYNNLNKKEKGSSPLISFIVVLLIVGGAVALIVTLKNATSRNLSDDGLFMSASDSVVAQPDVDPDEGSAHQDIPLMILPDTIMGTDARNVADAGYEDGYWAGYDDAHLGQERATYDESYTFASQAERATYASNYREGYKEGWEVGLRDKERKESKSEEVEEEEN